jgi:GAF domain-containing protein
MRETEDARKDRQDDVQHHLLQDTSITEFLRHLTGLGSELFGDQEHGEGIPCGLVSQRGKRHITVASSSATAGALNEVQYRIGEGPALRAMTAGEVITVDDGTTDPRWQEYFNLTAPLGYASMLAAPLMLGGEGTAALVFYASPTGYFTPQRLHMIDVFVRQAERALEMAMRVARHRDESDDLRSAMKSRTSIDLAVGIIIAQNRCTQEEAFNLLKDASNHRNIKIRDVAEALIVQATGKKSSTHFTA